jgi:hypothetical protein
MCKAIECNTGRSLLAALLEAVRTYEIIWSWASDGLTRRTTTYIQHSYRALALGRQRLLM